MAEPAGAGSPGPPPDCPVCESPGCREAFSAPDRVTGRVFAVRLCTGRGFMFTHPAPSPAGMAPYYQAGYEPHSGGPQGAAGALYRAARAVALRRRRALVRRREGPCRLVDIGCGTGEFAALMARAGYRADGAESSPAARKAASAALGAPVAASMEELEGAGTYRVAVMWHSLEHFHDPRAALAGAARLLAPGGLLIVAVPDRESPGARRYGPDWAAWDLPRHLSHFAARDVRRLLAEAGFEAPEESRLWLDAFYAAMLSERARGSGAAAAAAKGVLAGLASNLESLIRGGPAAGRLCLARRGAEARG